MPFFEKTSSGFSSGIAALMLCGFFCARLTSSADTRVVAWGDNSSGQTNVPPDLTNAVAIASGATFNLALKSDGTVVEWGDNAFNVPVGLTNVTDITCSSWVCLALKADGTVEGWGANWNGQADGSGLSNVVALATAEGESMAVLRDGTVVPWGGTWRAPVSGDTNNVRAIAADGNSDEDVFHLLHRDGTVTTYGSFFDGYVLPPSDLSNAVSVATGDDRAMALRSDGTVEEWGFNTNATPDGLTNVVAIADETALKSDGTVVEWNGNIPPPGLSNVVAITPTLALISDGPPVTRAVLSKPTLSANAFSLVLPTQNNRVFELEYNDSLTDNNWTSLLPLVAGTGTNMVLTDTNALGSHRFYRILRW